MSLEATTAAFNVRGLTPVQRLVLLVYADHCDESGRCWPSQSRVAERLEIGRQAVNRATKSMEKMGLLSIDHRAREGGGQTSNVVTINIERCNKKRQGVSLKATGGESYGDRGVNHRATGGESQGDTNLPLNLPSESPNGRESAGNWPSREEVLSQVGSVAFPLTRQCAEAFFDTRTAEGWVTAKGHPIADWHASLRGYARIWQNNGGDRKNGSEVSVKL